MGIRTIIIIIAVYGLYWIIRKLLNNNNNKRKIEEVEDMIECNYCGTHLPISDAIERDNKYYCCEQHSENNYQ